MQIDLEPRKHSHREPVFVPGAGRRAVIWAAIFAICVGVAVIVQFLMAPLEPIIRGLVSQFFN